MKKIFIFGFPHSGTTILKSIIGHIPEVHEELYEKKIITEDDLSKLPEDKKYILIKHPFTLPEYFTEKYDDYIKIFIMRNPLYVFSSLNKRFDYKLTGYHSFLHYTRTCGLFMQKSKENNRNNYFIKYEDLFMNNYQNLKNILDDIGLQYTDDIFNNSNYKNYSSSIVKEVPIERVNNKDHEKYRTWQINQPFEFANLPEKIDLTKEQMDEIINNRFVLELYPSINEDLK